MGLHKFQWSHYCSFVLLSLMAVSFIASTTNAGTGSWWAIGISGCGKRVRTRNDTCPGCASFRQNNTINENQETKCREDPGSFEGLSAGARQAIISCQAQFNSSLWNCSTLYGEYLFGAFVATTHTRETGVLNAYFTVGAIAGIAEDCHDQKIANCPCIVDNPRREDENANVVFEACRADYGFASRYVDSFNQIDDSHFGGKIDIHNIDVGKEVVNVEQESCRCHGVSGTCTVQTCYKHVPSVSDVSPILFIRYNGAIHVNTSASGEIVNVNEGHDAPTGSDIIFSHNSPNFCNPDPVRGVVGVANRPCDPIQGKPNSCSVLCCGHGFHSVTKRVAVEECAFVWCCRIECKITGHEDITQYFCNGGST